MVEVLSRVLVGWGASHQSRICIESQGAAPVKVSFLEVVKKKKPR